MRFGSHRRVRPTKTEKEGAPAEGVVDAAPGQDAQQLSSVAPSALASAALAPSDPASSAPASSAVASSALAPSSEQASLERSKPLNRTPSENRNSKSVNCGRAPRGLSFLFSLVARLQARTYGALRSRARRHALFIAAARSAALTALWFMPGAFFVMIGVCVAFAPQMLMTAIAGFCVFFGLASFGLAWKFIQLKNRVERVAQSFETRIMVQAIPHGKVAEPEERTEQLVQPSAKKILFH